MPSTWPHQLDYFEAAQTPAQSFSDPDLQCAVAAEDHLGMPRPWSGNFASVYQFQSADGRRSWAVKCFTRPVPRPNVRYEEISCCLGQIKLPLTVDFEYVEQGIRIRDEWFPIVKMEWVAGQTLRQFVVEQLDSPHILDRMFDLWLKVEQWLSHGGIVHGDLQHANLLMVSGVRKDVAELKLIDYDGIWAPSLSQHPSHEFGHSAYQHPYRARDGVYGPDVDRFPNLVIACALKCLARPDGRSLWERYDNGDNLLFTKSDFEEPQNSRLLQELWESGDAEVQAWAGHVVLASQSPISETPLLSQIVSDGRILPLTQQALIEARQFLFPPLPDQQSATRSPPMIRPAAARKLRNMFSLPRIAVVVSTICGALAAGLMLHLPGGHRGDTSAERVAGRDWQNGSASPDASGREAVARLQAAAVDPAADRNRAPAATGDPFAGTVPGQKRENNELKLSLVWCPPGEFLLYSQTGASPAAPQENPPVRVALEHGFWLGQYEVTQRQWRQLMHTTPWHRKKRGEKEGDDYPATFVNWKDAVDFCKRLTVTEHRAGRLSADWEFALPTEAEWEYACRAQTTEFDGIETDQARLNDYVWHNGNVAKSGTKQAQRVGRKRPNPWGLYDMLGNVWEWCLETDGRGHSEPFDSDSILDREKRVERGGSWSSRAALCRPAFRVLRDAAHHADNQGFRVACRRTEP